MNLKNIKKKVLWKKYALKSLLKETQNIQRLLKETQSIQRVNLANERAIKRQLAVQEIKSNGFWFVDIPRTSSTSVKVELGVAFGPTYNKINVMGDARAGDQNMPDHISAVKLIDSLGEKNYNDLLTFSIVRNPWGRALSFFNYRRLSKTIPQDWSFTDYCERLCDAEQHSTFFEYPPYRMTMTDFICDENRKVLVKKIIRFENRRELLSEIGRQIGLNDLGAVRLQNTAQLDHDYRPHYTEQTAKIIGDYYINDVNLFGYNF